MTLYVAFEEKQDAALIWKNLFKKKILSMKVCPLEELYKFHVCLDQKKTDFPFLSVSTVQFFF